MPFSSNEASSTANASNVLNNFTQAFSYTSEDVVSLSSWIVAMISSGQNRNLCMDHLKSLFQALRSFYYPSNTGPWSANLFLFLKSLPAFFIKRIKK